MIQRYIFPTFHHNSFFVSLESLIIFLNDPWMCNYGFHVYREKKKIEEPQCWLIHKYLKYDYFKTPKYVAKQSKTINLFLYMYILY